LIIKNLFITFKTINPEFSTPYHKPLKTVFHENRN